MPGIYIHIPFCRRKCIYCSFFSKAGKTDRSGYFTALESELDNRYSTFFGTAEAPDTIYFGGGTPSSAEVSSYIPLTDKIRNLSGHACIREATFEMNPEDVSEDYAGKLPGIGINRISMGVQSFHDEDLRWMNRRHDSQGAVKAFETLRKCGFDNISMDLIFGYDGLTPQRWEYSIDRIIALAPEHISAYQMSIEPGSMLGRLYENGKYKLPDDETCRREYEMLREKLFRAGYIQYEISNFAKPGYEAIHNSSYWNGEKYLGLGASAHSYDGNRKREWGPDNLDQYIRDTESGTYAPEYEILTDTDIFNEKLMTGLRRIQGIPVNVLENISPEMTTETIRCMERLNSLYPASSPAVLYNTTTIRLNPEYLFISDSIISELFAVGQED